MHVVTRARALCCSGADFVRPFQASTAIRVEMEVCERRAPMRIRCVGRDPESALDARRNREDFGAVTRVCRIQRLRPAQALTVEAGRCCWLARAILTEGDTILSHLMVY
jgi:hypothetical protein